MPVQQDPDVRLWPRPQAVEWTGGSLSLATPLVIALTGDADWLASEAIQAADVLNDATGVIVAGIDGEGPRFTITTMDRLPAGAAPVEAAEGYVLLVDSGGVTLAANQACGVFWGAQTLAELLRQSPGESLPGVAIRDWPRFPQRGMHIYMPGRDDLPFFLAWLDVMARYKCNTLILEVGGGMELPRHPEVNTAWRDFVAECWAFRIEDDTHVDTQREVQDKVPRHPWGPNLLGNSRAWHKDSIHPELGGGAWITQDEVRHLLAECAKRHIQVIPEIQSLSHCYWLCLAYPEIAERQEDPWPDTYCPSNPRSYELLFECMDEILEVFQPQIVCIGHDELYTMRLCPECRKHPAYRLLADDITRIHGYLAQRGMRTMLWGDTLMNITMPDGQRQGGVIKTQTKGLGRRWYMPAVYRAAELVPRDLIIADWYWSMDPESERHFHEHGFEVLYGNFSPFGFKGWAERSDHPYVLGAEVSTWCEVSATAFGHNRITYQLFGTADLVWNGEQLPKPVVVDRMAPELARLHDDLLGDPRWLVSGGEGELLPIDLSRVAVSLRGEEESGGGQEETAADLTFNDTAKHHRPRRLGRLRAPAEITTLLGTGRFRLLTNEGVIDRGVVVSPQQPGPVVVPINALAQRLLLLHGTTMQNVYWRPTFYSFHRGPGVPVEYHVRYADGTAEQFTGEYGVDLGLIAGRWPGSGPGHCYRAVPVALESDHTLFAREWLNPWPDTVIESVTVHLGPDATPDGVVLLAAVSVVQ